jgi:Methyltransferase domain
MGHSPVFRRWAVTAKSKLRRLIGHARRYIRELVKGDPRAVIFETLPKDSVGVEVGVWKGDMSAKLLQKVRPKKLLLIDPWTFDPRFPGSLFGGGSARSQADMDAVWRKVVKRFGTEIGQGVVSIHRCTSAEFASSVAAETLDWVYIDGNHTYECVLEDLRSWYPKVRPGGLLAGDDYDRPDGWWDDGVTKAVQDFASAEAVRVEAIRNHQYVLRKIAPS